MSISNVNPNNYGQKKTHYWQNTQEIDSFMNFANDMKTAEIYSQFKKYRNAHTNEASPWPHTGSSKNQAIYKKNQKMILQNYFKNS